mmetsp:Transcript_50889/g.140856  ORF Transcript_50889/g.140856 Transcript_50889/m.140856 type:complete len:232 (-) Transcript_50889:286-981(-)
MCGAEAAMRRHPRGRVSFLVETSSASGRGEKERRSAKGAPAAYLAAAFSCFGLLAPVGGSSTRRRASYAAFLAAYASPVGTTEPVRRMPVSYQLATTTLAGGDGGFQPGGGSHSSRAGGGGIVPAPRCGPALPPISGHTVGCAAGSPWRPATKSLKPFIMSSNMEAGFGGVAGGGGVGAGGGIRRLPESYHDETGGVGGFQPGGGVHSSRTGGGGIVPAIRCGPAVPPTGT